MADIIFSGQSLETGAVGIHDADLFRALVSENLTGVGDMSGGLIWG